MIVDVLLIVFSCMVVPVGVGAGAGVVVASAFELRDLRREAAER